MAKETTKKPTDHTKIIYVAVGVFVTLVNYVMYLILAPVFGNSDWRTVSIAGFVAVVTALILHSRLTWRGRKNGRAAAIKFIVYNIFLIAALQPALIWFFDQNFWNWLYDFAFWLTSWVGWDEAFVRRTGLFGLTSCITMIVNFLVYDRLVFRKKT